MKKLLLVCFFVTIFLGITIGGNAATKYMWNAGTTEEGSTGYVSIGILSETTNTYAGDHIFMTPIAYARSLVGLRGFDQKEVVSMYASSQQFDQIINKWGPFSPETYKWSAPYTQMMWMYDLDYFFLIRKEDADKIKSWSDLAHRKVFSQMRGTGSYEIVKVMFGPGGLNIWDTIDQKSFHLSHAADALKLGEVDAVIAYSAGGQIVGYAQEVITRTDCVLLSTTPEELEKIMKSADFLFPAEVSPEGYGQDVGLTKTIRNPALGFVYIVDPDVPEEIVYQATKAIWENAEKMAKAVAVWGKFSEDPWGYNLPYLMKYKKLGAPIHPGALRYFRELGHNTKVLGLE
jgi:TRAP transporter TAXI family solute receptor